MSHWTDSIYDIDCPPMPTDLGGEIYPDEWEALYLCQPPTSVCSSNDCPF